MDTLEVGGEVYTKVPRQRPDASVNIEVYRGRDTFLRIGEESAVTDRLGVHTSMAKAGFPVAPIVKRGTLLDKHYYIEKSLGPQSFTSIFGDDIKADEVISAAHFDAFLFLVERFFRAQIKAAIQDRKVVSFAKGIHLEILCSELPKWENQIRARFEDVLTRTRDFPYVLTHGDFNPTNMYPEGVIDLEDSFEAPVGFDIVSAVATAKWFPRTGDFESLGRYTFSEEQIRKYYAHMDDASASQNLPQLSQYATDFEFARAVWLCARMGKWPKLQKWRFEKFITQYLA